MGRRPRGSWPGTPAEWADRDRVVTLAKRVGKNRLVFSTHELRREMAQVERLSLNASGDLARHLAALEDDLVVEVGRRDFGSGGRSRKKYVLRSRLIEFERMPESSTPEFDDVERAQQALWVAVEASGVEEVPTRLVTEVLRNIEPLAPTRPDEQTYNLLERLVRRRGPAAEKVKRDGERWRRWRPLGPRPDHAEFDQWVAEFKRLKATDADLTRLGQATAQEVGRELVRIAVRTRASSRYPQGKSVRMSEIRDTAGSDGEAKRQAESIRRRARSLGQVISDAARDVIDGRERVAARVVRVRGPLSDNVYYDVPDEPGFERRRRIVWLKDLRRTLQGGALERIEQDQREAQDLRSLYPEAGLELEAVIAGRALLGQREFEGLEDVLKHVAAMEPSFSRAVRNEIAQHRRTLRSFLGKGIWTGEEEEVLNSAARRLGIEVQHVLSVQRPLIRPDEYVGWFPEGDLRDYTPGEFMALAATVRRFLNPRYTHRNDPDANHRYYWFADRVEALSYAAEKLMARSAAPLAAGARLLGRNLRSAVLVRCLGESSDPALRRDAMAALTLLGEPGAAAIGAELLSDASAPSDAVASTLWVLHVAGELDVQALPAHVRSSRSWVVSSALREVILAQAHKRVIV